MADNNQGEAGFDYGGRFYPWRVTDMGKDLMLIDRISGLPIADFFDVIDDDHERGRGPILLTLIATSLRAGNPSWSVERIARTVSDLSLTADVAFVGGGDNDQEEDEVVPVPPERPKLDVVPSTSAPFGSSPSSTPEGSSDSAMSYGAPV